MHFFIDTEGLPEQTAADMRFGPSDANATTRFNLTTQFALTADRKAFACEAGMMVVQKNASNPAGLVNLIIKPTTPTKINGVCVKYYIYRGVRLSSFFSGVGSAMTINPKNNSNTEFVASFWSYQEKVRVFKPLISNSPLSFGYGDTGALTDSCRIKDIFNGSLSAKAFPVKAGMWIGDFRGGTQLGFEVEVMSEWGTGLGTLEEYRSPRISYSIPESLTDLEEKRKRHYILRFIDPAAFFGMHASTGVSTTTYAGAIKNPSVLRTLTANDFYSNILDKFANKNRVYLDVRSERGVSYNFYNNYKIDNAHPENIRINGANEAGAVVYGISGWPLHFIDTSTRQVLTNKNKITFRLRINDNTRPVLFIENSDLTSSNRSNKVNFYKEDTLIVEGAEWTNTTTLYFESARTYSNPDYANISCYIKLYYYHGDPIAATNTTHLRNTKYFDSAFCSIDLEDIGSISGSYKNPRHVENSSIIYIKDRNEDGTGNFDYTAQSGAYWDSERILFYSKTLNKSKGSGKFYLNTGTRRLSSLTINNGNFSSALGNRINIVCKPYTGANAQNKILGLNSYYENGAFQEKEALMFLGLTLEEMDAVKTVTGLSTFHHKYIYLHPDFATHHLNDTSASHHRYYRYVVKVQGLNSAGQPDIVTPSVPAFGAHPARTILVYSRDNLFFSSAAFADHEPLDFGPNQVEYRIFQNGTIQINDNIDLSLIRKSNDAAIAGDTNVEQSIWYYYYPQARPAVLLATTLRYEVCHLPVREVNKLKSGVVVMDGIYADNTTNIPAGFNTVLVANYPIGNARTTYRNNNWDIFTIGLYEKDFDHNGTKETYENYKIRYAKLDQKTFLVRVGEVNQPVSINNNRAELNIRFAFGNTMRRYSKPELVAGLIGALIEVRDIANVPNTDHNYSSAGFAFENSSCFPSVSHVNGEAIDSRYRTQDGLDIAGDHAFITAMRRFGFEHFHAGMLALASFPDGTPRGYVTIDGQHGDHLHSEDFNMRNV